MKGWSRLLARRSVGLALRGLALRGLGLLGIGCGPEVVGTSDGGGTTSTGSADAGTSTGSTASPGVDSTAATSEDGPADTDLCVAWCLGAEARGCAPGFHDEACFTRCIARLEALAGDACEAEQREILGCEAQAGAPAEPTCEARECEDAYKRADLCAGSCLHLGGIPGAGASPTACEWRGTSCYGYDFEVVCPVGDAAGACTCAVDGEVIAECEVGVALAPFECESDDLQLFTGCCRETFEGVLFP